MTPTKTSVNASSRLSVGRFLSLVVIAAMVLFSASFASAQIAGKGAIKGVVTDPTGAVISNATVVATSTARGTKVTGVSNASGEYTVSPLDPDIYTLSISAPGFKSTTQQNVHVNALEVADVPVSLAVGSSTETVNVDTAPPQLETSNATLGSTMENDMYSALPIEMGAYGSPDQRRATDFAFLMPGVQGNNTSGNPTTNTGIVNGSGSRGAVSAVYVDGLPFVRAGGNGDPRYIWTAMSVDAIDQFQVQTSGYSAIYEGQGIQNYTIKQGGTKFHGGVFEFFRNTALDTWGFFGPVPNPATGQKVKPIEHSNEFGVNLSGPLVPFGTWRDKLFFFGNYTGFHYSSQTPTQLTFPTLAQQQGDFSGICSSFTSAGVCNSSVSGQNIQLYDPTTQTACTTANSGKPCRNPYPFNKIPSSQFSAVALKMQSFLPSGIGTALQNNYISPNATGLKNWSTTDRIDYMIGAKDTLTMQAAIGRQASSNPVGQTTAGRNVGPIPYNYGQTYAPKTAVGIIEETHIFNPSLVNQIKWGYARYNGPTFDADQLPAYSATTMGITGLPVGAAQQAFPITTFAGANAPTGWGGTGPGVTIAQNYTALDNLQWVKGNHTLTFGGQVAWMLYNVNNATGGTTPVTLANAVTETAGLNNAFTTIANTGNSYASFLIGQIDTVSFTSYLQQIFGTRFRAISPYVQDNWKITPKLTLDLGLRYDFFPTLTEVHNSGSFFNPNLANSVTGTNGALQFTGTGTNTCNCSTPVNNYYKNFGPRIGAAYQLDPKTVLRASWGVMFTHGNAVGGSSTSLGTLGFSTQGKFGPSSSLLSTSAFTGNSGAVPAYTPATGAASGPTFGTGNTNTAGFTTSSPSSMGYADPYLGSRAPEYINYTLGFQHQWTNALTTTMTYVGSQGHFLPADGSNARGFWADQLDPKYLSLGTHLADTGVAATADCTTFSLPCPTNFNSTQQLNVALKPFPFQAVGDSFGYVANSNYNALQTVANWRGSHGITFTASYTWSRSIDNGGTFRSGYAIPAAYSNNGKSWKADAIERNVSTSNQPQHVVVTGVWDLPFGKTVLANSGWERAVFGGFRFSEALQAYSGSPIALTGSACQTNQAQSGCPVNLNPLFAGSARVNGKWGQGITAANTGAISYIAASGGTQAAPTGPFIAPGQLATSASFPNGSPFAPNYTFSNGPRTAAYNLYGPGNYNLDISLQRSFPLHWEGAKFNFRADMYNVTNHTKFAIASTQLGNSAFGQVTNDTTATRKAVQLSGRIEF